MAQTDDSAEANDDGTGPAEPQPCMPCHGSGEVISSLGGAQHKLTCPWCRGGGVRIAGADAQEYRREHSGSTAS